jgi:hypothetical protein
MPIRSARLRSSVERLLKPGCGWVVAFIVASFRLFGRVFFTFVDVA